ncbi:hypothetical protein HZS_6510 [Henneguya salminicola]|nr:hypothetical protein HZS_6510 [Henneguya salminicola]
MQKIIKLTYFLCSKLNNNLAIKNTAMIGEKQRKDNVLLLHMLYEVVLSIRFKPEHSYRWRRLYCRNRRGLVLQTGNTIISVCLRLYDMFVTMILNHQALNDSENFVKLLTGAPTKNIECTL